MGKLVAGKTARITCRSPGTCAGTAPVITWEGKYGTWQSFQESYPNTTSEYSSIITFTPSKEDNNLRLLCRASFLQGTARTEQSISLNVEYAPHVSITAAGATDQSFIVKEGDTKMISCNVDSNPAAEITWSVGDKVIQGPTTAPQLIYRLNRINLSDAGNYSCFGKNDHGTSHRTINIIVHYQPRTPTITCSTTEDCAIDSQRMVNVMENSTLSLLCKAGSLPEASLSWETPGKQTIVNGQLTLHDISLSDEGKFTCVASNIHGKSESSITIKVTYEPRKVTGRNSTCWTHGSHIECHCIIQSYPTAKVEWNVNEKLYPSNHSDERVNIFTVTLNAVTNSTLTSSQTNIGSIQCRSSNKHGRLDLLLFSRTYSHSTTKIIAVTSCVIVIVLLLIGSLFVVHLFKKKKLTNKKEDNKEIRENDCNVIYSNTGPHLYGNNTEEVESSSVQDDSNASVYMNVEDMHLRSGCPQDPREDKEHRVIHSGRGWALLYVLIIQAPRECIYRTQNMRFSRIWNFVDYWTFIFTAFQLWIYANCQLPPGYKIQVNETIRVQKGLCVHVPCTFSVPTEISLTTHANGYWLKISRESSIVVASRVNGIYYTNRRFYLIGDVTSGDCSYYIEEPLEEDESLYAFRMVDIPTKLTYTDIFPSVVVTALTDKPTISTKRLQDGKEVTLTCTSPGRCRNIIPRISWAGSITGSRQKMYDIKHGDGTRTFHSNITFIPRKSYNKSPLNCIVTFKNNLVTSEKKTLNIEYSPSMNIIIEGVDGSNTTSVIVKDGDSITMKCMVDSNPNAAVMWYKDGSEIHQNISNQTVILKLSNINPIDAGSFLCSAINEHGVTNRTVEIIYESTMLLLGAKIAAAVGGVVIFVLIVIIGVLLITSLRKKRKQHIQWNNQRNNQGNQKDTSVNNTDAIYTYAEFTAPDVNPPEETLGEAPQFSSGDLVYADPDEVQYSSIAFSKRPKPNAVQKYEQTEYSEIRKT
ncbi:hemicentin-1-like isoform X2 [Dendropsophus ebraccatus]|uniref:hemicentin-1-like isoform X2 n=1 Tax=Dendropsophus ebraccatus TaxID=150705 RepID=UPI003831F449